MSLWSRLFNRAERKESSVGNMLFQQFLGRAAWPDREPSKLALEGYRQQVVAFSCIHLVAQSVASLEWCLYQKAKSGEESEIETHPALDLIEDPNPLDDRESFVRAFMTWYWICGNAYAERVDGMGGVPVELHNLRADRMKVIPGPNGYPAAYEYKVGQNARRMDVDLDRGIRPVLHLREPNPLDDYYGMSRLDPSGYSIDTHTSASALVKALLDNSARPSGAFVYKGDTGLSQDQLVSLREQVQAMYQGAQNAGRPLLLDGQLEWQTIGMSPADMQFIEGKNNSAREIAFALGVPPLLLGINGDNTFANFEEANRAFWRHTVLPTADRLCRAFSKWLLPAYGQGLYFEIDDDEIPALASERAAKWASVENADFLTVNEKREALGYGPLPEGGDVVLVPSSMTPLADAGLMPEPMPAGNEVADELDDEPAPKSAPVASQAPNIVNFTLPERVAIDAMDTTAEAVDRLVKQVAEMQPKPEPKLKVVRVLSRTEKGYIDRAVVETLSDDDMKELA